MLDKSRLRTYNKNMKIFYVYILTNHTNTTLYVGVTNNIERRTFEHQQKFNDGFAERYNTYKLVYAEEVSTSYDAIVREKQLKKWSRKKKIDLINSLNPEWKNLLS